MIEVTTRRPENHTPRNSYRSSHFIVRIQPGSIIGLLWMCLSAYNLDIGMFISLISTLVVLDNVHYERERSFRRQATELEARAAWAKEQVDRICQDQCATLLPHLEQEHEAISSLFSESNETKESRTFVVGSSQVQSSEICCPQTWT